jgi:hypothetical protein
VGQSVMRRSPKYVQGFVDRHGKSRFYFRRPGFKSEPLPGLPWSPEFMAAYETVLAGQPLQIGGARIKPGTFRSLAVSYFCSTAFRTIKSSTQSVYRNAIERLCGEHGDKGATTLQREHVVKLMAAKAERPGATNRRRHGLCGVEPSPPTAPSFRPQPEFAKKKSVRAVAIRCWRSLPPS